MQMNQTNRTQFSGNKANRPIPGMKLAYGSQAQQRPIQPQAAPVQTSGKTANPGLFSRLKESLLNLVTEESGTSNERPIGISRLSNTTFQASAQNQSASFFKSSQPIQDYRFNQLIDPRPTYPRR